MTNIEVQ